MNIEKINNNFLKLDQEEKFLYLIELGDLLPNYPENKKTEEYKIKGCSSNVWVVTRKQHNIFYTDLTSDTKIIKGLLYIIYLCLNNKNLKNIQNTNLEKLFDDLGIKNILSNQRQIGLLNIIEKINQDLLI